MKISIFLALFLLSNLSLATAKDLTGERIQSPRRKSTHWLNKKVSKAKLVSLNEDNDQNKKGFIFLPSTCAPGIHHRGDEGPFDKSDVAKFATVLGIVNAGFISLAPVKALTMNGLHHTPLTEYITEWIGHILVAQSITEWCLYFAGTTLNKAVGSGILYTVIFTIQSLLNDMPEKIGFSASGQWLFLVINTLSGYTLLTSTNVPVTNNLLKFYPIFSMMIALPFCFKPHSFGESWGVHSDDVQAIYEMKQIGFALLTKAIYLLLLGCGIEPTAALGYSNVPKLAGMIITNYITKEVKEVDMPSAVQNAFFVLHLLLLWSLAL